MRLLSCCQTLVCLESGCSGRSAMVVGHHLQQRSVSRSLRKTNTYSERASQVTLIQSMSVFVRLVKSSLSWTYHPPRLSVVFVCRLLHPCVWPGQCPVCFISSWDHTFWSVWRGPLWGHKSADPFCLLKHLSSLCLSAEEIPHRKGSLWESVTNRESPCTGEGNHAPTIRWVCFTCFLLSHSKWSTWENLGIWDLHAWKKFLNNFLKCIKVVYKIILKIPIQ